MVKTKNRFTPEQMAYLKEKVKIARERAGRQKQAEKRLSDFKMGVQRKRARLGSNLDFRRPSKAQVFSSISSLAGKAKKGGLTWAKHRKMRKANGLESHYASVNKRMGL
jgi:hypothetical protein